MRDDEISEHCLCDKCAGHECGADNPEERAAEEKRAREARDNQMREEGAKAERERVLNIILSWGAPISPNDIKALLNAPLKSPSSGYCQACVDGIAAPCKLPESGCKCIFILRSPEPTQERDPE